MSDNITPVAISAERKLTMMRFSGFAALILFIVVLLIIRPDHIRFTDNWRKLSLLVFVFIPNAVATYYEGRWSNDPSLSSWSRRSPKERITNYLFCVAVVLLLHIFRPFNLVQSAHLIFILAVYLLAPYFIGRWVTRRRVERA